MPINDNEHQNERNNYRYNDRRHHNRRHDRQNEQNHDDSERSGPNSRFKQNSSVPLDWSAAKTQFKKQSEAEQNITHSSMNGNKDQNYQYKKSQRQKKFVDKRVRNEKNSENVFEFNWSEKKKEYNNAVINGSQNHLDAKLTESFNENI